MTESQAREALIKDLNKHWWVWDSNGDSIADDIADFIIKDRQRIVQPLVKYKDSIGSYWGKDYSDKVTEETLKLAGLEK